VEALVTYAKKTFNLPSGSLEIALHWSRILSLSAFVKLNKLLRRIAESTCVGDPDTLCFRGMVSEELEEPEDALRSR